MPRRLVIASSSFLPTRPAPKCGSGATAGRMYPAPNDRGRARRAGGGSNMPSPTTSEARSDPSSTVASPDRRTRADGRSLPVQCVPVKKKINKQLTKRAACHIGCRRAPRVHTGRVAFFHVGPFQQGGRPYDGWRENLFAPRAARVQRLSSIGPARGANCSGTTDHVPPWS